MRTALRTKGSAPRLQVSQTKSYPAPVGGWNARDALATMSPNDAIILDNWFPRASYVELRGGYTPHTTGSSTVLTTEDGLGILTESGDLLATEDTVTTISGTIKTLMTYNALDGLSNKLIAITQSNVYDITNGGPVGGSVAVRTDGKHQWTMFGDGTNQWLIACNGQDKPLYFNGTTWTAVDSGTSPALTGVTSTELVAPIKHKGRLYFIRRNSLVLYYLSAGVAGGALTAFDLSADCKRGGYLMAGASWTRDAGDGQDDVLVLVTSEGEALVYQGNNPSSAANWALIGSFYIGTPLGRRCLSQYGGELIVLTENGAFAISAALLTASVTTEKALSDKIVRAFTEAARVYGDTFGWEATVFPAQQALIVNVPIQEDGTHYQYVMNTQTKSWSRFTGWPAETFCVFERELYFASGGVVYKAWDGFVDNTSTITWYGKQAYSQFGYTGLKRPGMFRPHFITNGGVNYSAAIDTDFDESNLNAGNLVAAITSQPIWGQMTWGSFIWAGSDIAIHSWGTTSQHPGHWLSGKIKGSSNNARLQWMASDLIYETGSGL